MESLNWFWKKQSPIRLDHRQSGSRVKPEGSLFQNLSQKLFSDRDPLKFSQQYSGRVRIIFVFDSPPELFQAGDDVGRIWENYRNVEGNFHKQSIAVFQRYGASCPSAGCGRCEFANCFFSEFIRNYWDCPHGD